MLVIAIKDRQNGARRGFVKLTVDGRPTRRALHCDTASHFMGATAAALCRDRVILAYPDLLTVESCSCVMPAETELQISRA